MQTPIKPKSSISSVSTKRKKNDKDKDPSNPNALENAVFCFAINIFQEIELFFQKIKILYRNYR